MEAELTELFLDRPLPFSCGPTVACFNRCCRDLNQFLTPYDILRLKQGLNLTSGEFLQQCASIHDGPETGLPVVSFRTSGADGHRCPLVSATGCRVYRDRPSSCRAYPVMRLASRSRETGQVTERYFLLKEPHCRGFESKSTQSLNQWIADQGLRVYNEMNDRVLLLISLKNRLRPGPLDIRTRHLWVTALYDLDGFRRQIYERQLRKDDRFDPKLRKAAESDQKALLELAIDWVQKELFE